MSEWISVDDRLPEDFDPVLMFATKSRSWYGVGFWCGGRVSFNGVSAHPSAVDFGVTHWMPLPEPPND